MAMAQKKPSRLELELAFERLQALREEQQRRVRSDKLKHYNQGELVHRKQLEFHRDRHRNRWIFGGNRTGKTEAGAVEAAWWARGNHPYRRITGPTRGWIVSLTNEVQRDVAQKKFLSYIDPEWIVDVQMRAGRKDDIENGVIDFIVIKSAAGGLSTVGFKSCDQGRDKFQGTSQDWIWFDEEPPVQIYEECRMRIIDRQGDIWGTMTPLMGLTWVYDVIYNNQNNDPNVKYWLMAWEDNPFLSKDEIDLLIATMSEEEREARQYGRFVALTGLVYREFHEDVHVIDPFTVPASWYDGISLDPGLDHPLSCHFYAVNEDGDVFVIAEHYQSGWDVERHANRIREIANDLEWRFTNSGYLQVLGDSAANQRTLAAQKSVTELFWDFGIQLNTKVIKDKWAGIQRVKTFLKLQPNNDKEIWPKGKPKLFIFRTCPNMIKEFKNYRWDEKKVDEPKKIGDDAMDDLRYYIMTRPEPHKPTQLPPSRIQLDKAQLEKKIVRRDRRLL